ncbi:MAG: branched-chain amino acid ABC transporter permease [Parvibaculales bacterium]
MAEFLQLLIIGISQGCVYGLIAMGFVMIYKATEMVNFAQGDIMMFGAFVAFTFSAIVGLNFWLALVCAVLTMAVFGFLVDMVVVRRIIGQPQFSVVILTISLGFIFRAAAGMIWGQSPLSLDTPFAGQSNIAGAVIGHDRLAIMGGTFLVVTAIWAFLRYSRWGLAMQAASQNQLASFYVGIPVKLVYSGVWALAAAISCIAGVLLAPITLIGTLNGFLGIKAFAAAVIGGFGSLPGALVGGLIIGIAEPFAAAYLPEVKNIIGYLIMFAVLMLRPEGLFATIYQKKV